MASPAQYAKTQRYIQLARDEGAELVTGGGRPPGLAGQPGLYLAPTLFRGVRPDMRIAQEEVFGPELATLTWKHEDDAIRIANSVGYGLTGSIWTSDIGRAHRVAAALEAGYLWINGAATHFTGGSVRRRQAVRNRPRGEPGRAAQLHPAEDHQRHPGLTRRQVPSTSCNAARIVAGSRSGTA